MAGCVFCEVPAGKRVAGNSLVYAYRDQNPVTFLHTLIIPVRHAETFFDLTKEEVAAAHELLIAQKETLRREDPSIEGFNIGVNCGEVAGQTVFHCHIHLIPRRKGDVAHPRGGVRHVIPGKGDYK